MSETIFIPDITCIIIASHISNPKRIIYLFECLKSLLLQSIPVSIFLSISFENIELQNNFANTYSENKFYHNHKLYILIKKTKTPQMRHMAQLLPHIEKNYQWLLFCDDDDTYDEDRVLAFTQTIVNCSNEIKEYPDKEFVGIYETINGNDHKKERHEYWTYCVNIKMLQIFINKLLPHPHILDHQCCDVLFAEYLRRCNNNYLYGTVTKKYYNYRIHNNIDSVTGNIRETQKQIRTAKEVNETNLLQCAKELDEYLNDNLDKYIHDTFVRTIIGYNFNQILINEFKSEYAVLNYINKEHINKLEKEYNYIYEVANEIYHIKL